MFYINRRAYSIIKTNKYALNCVCENVGYLSYTYTRMYGSTVDVVSETLHIVRIDSTHTHTGTIVGYSASRKLSRFGTLVWHNRWNRSFITSKHSTTSQSTRTTQIRARNSSSSSTYLLYYAVAFSFYVCWFFVGNIFRVTLFRCSSS